MNSEILAVGGYFLEKGVRTYPGVATIALSSFGNWSEWNQEEQRKDERNGFMATQVPYSWVRHMCQDFII